MLEAAELANKLIARDADWRKLDLHVELPAEVAAASPVPVAAAAGEEGENHPVFRNVLTEITSWLPDKWLTAKQLKEKLALVRASAPTKSSSPKPSIAAAFATKPAAEPPSSAVGA